MYFSPTRRRKGFFHLPRLLVLKIASNLTLSIAIGAVILFLLTLFLFIWYSRDLPQPGKVRRVDNISTVIYDKNGEVLYDIFSDQNRVPVTLNEIPKYLREATIAIEDKDFYKHQGVDPKGLFRALFRIITLQGVQGGSTLSQQLVKNVLLTNERSVERKIKEFILTTQIERKYSKDEILQMYLNEAPYGGTAWGVEVAAETYFGKHAKDLTLVQCAILAGLPQLPSYYNPFGSNPKAYVGRTKDVLRRMREEGYIDKKLEDGALKELDKMVFAKEGTVGFKAPHFVMYVREQLIRQFGEQMVSSGGLRVTTTIDLKLQESVEKIVKEEIDNLKGLSVSNGAVVVLDPKTGEIRALVGSKEYFSTDEKFQGKFDVATQGLRQPGSALKPITYAVALSKGYTPSSVVLDVDTKFPGGANQKDYNPKNYDGKYRGPVQLRYALANSINVPAVKLTAWVGVRDILRQSYDMGISSLEPTDETLKRVGLSLTLGGAEVTLLDLVSAYGVFATGGIRQPVYSISKVTDTHGTTLFEQKKSSGKKVMDTSLTYLISSMLSDNDARKDVFGLNSYLKVAGKTVAVKTGTTDDKRDNWTVGYTPSIVTGVWVGNNDNSPMDPKLASGITGAAPIWNRVMKEALKDSSDEPFSIPDGVIEKEIDAFAGGLPKEGMPKRKEYYLKGTEPTSISTIYKKIKLSKSDNKKKASVIDIATGNYDEKDFYVFEETDPISTDGKNRFQEGIDNWVNSQADEKYKVPKDTSSADENQVIVSIKKPSDYQQLDSNDVEIRAEVSSVKGVKKIEIYSDDSLKKTIDHSSNIDETINLDTGIHKIKVRAYNDNDHPGDSTITVGIKVDPKTTPSPTP